MYGSSADDDNDIREAWRFDGAGASSIVRLPRSATNAPPCRRARPSSPARVSSPAGGHTGSVPCFMYVGRSRGARGRGCTGRVRGGGRGALLVDDSLGTWDV